MTVTIENTSVDTALNIAELTQGSLTGNGVFDVLLQTLRLHLDREFTSGRITGTAYATVYSQAITSFLQQAVQFCLSKSKLALELKQMQEEVELIQLQQTKLIADTRQVDYVTDYQLPADTALKAKQLDLADYDLTIIKPQELALLEQQVALQTYTVTNRLPAEVAQIEAETSHIGKQELNTVQQTNNLVSQQTQIESETDRILYQTNYVMPEEVTVIKLNQDQLIAQNNKIATDTVVAIKQGHLTDAQSCEVKAQTNRINAEVKLKLPEEVELIKRNQAQLTAQSDLLAYDLSDIKPKEADLLQAKVVEQTYINTDKLPVEVANLTSTGLNIVATTANLAKQGSLLDSQKVVTDKEALQIVSATNQTIYKTNYMMPEELKILRFNQDQLVAQITKLSADTVVTSKQANLVDAQVCETEAQTNQINANVALRLPEEVELIKRNQNQVTAQISEINYRVSDLLPSQLAQTEAQTAQVVYSTTYTLPAQVNLTEAQTDNANKQSDLYAQKIVTETAQAQSTPAATSVMGVQNALMTKQKENYDRDAEQKAAKMLIDTWGVRYNDDPLSAVPSATNKLEDTSIGAAVDKLLTGIGVP